MSKSKIIRQEIPFIPNAELEHRANLLLNRYETEVDKILFPPVPVERIVELLLDLTIDWCPIHDTNEEPILAYINPSAMKIAINEKRRPYFDKYFGTIEYTIAHEVGHWDLHVHETELQQIMFSNLTQNVFLCRGDRRDRREIQADRYASFLTMPEKLLRPFVAGLEIQWKHIYELREKFNVSTTAMRIRLENLGLIFVSPEGTIYPSKAAYAGQLTLW